WKDDVAVSVAANLEGVQRLAADLSLLKVGVNGVRARQNVDLRQNVLLFGPGGGAEDIRPLAKVCGQFLKPAARPALAALADVYAVRQIEGEGIAIRVLAAPAEWAQVGDQFIAAYAVRGQ